MKAKSIVSSLSLILAVTSVQAMNTDLSLIGAYESEFSNSQSATIDRLYLAGKTKDVTKTTTKTKKDGTVVTKEVKKTNDGQGNKETTRTTTTTPPSSGGSGGASYEGY